MQSINFCIYRCCLIFFIRYSELYFLCLITPLLPMLCYSSRNRRVRFQPNPKSEETDIDDWVIIFPTTLIRTTWKMHYQLVFMLPSVRLSISLPFFLFFIFVIGNNILFIWWEAFVIWWQVRGHELPAVYGRGSCAENKHCQFSLSVNCFASLFHSVNY